MNNVRKTNDRVEVVNPHVYFPEGTPIPEQKKVREPLEHYRF